MIILLIQICNHPLYSQKENNKMIYKFNFFVTYIKFFLYKYSTLKKEWQSNEIPIFQVKPIQINFYLFIYSYSKVRK